MPPALGRATLRNLELILTAAGLGVIAAVPAALRPAAGRYWVVVAVTAVGVGLVHGVLFWLVRRRQRQVRAATLREARDVLTDVVNNKLQLMLVHLEELNASASARAPAAVDRASLVAARDAAAHVSALLSALSDESLRSWKARYPALPHGR